MKSFLKLDRRVTIFTQLITPEEAEEEAEEEEEAKKKNGSSSSVRVTYCVHSFGFVVIHSVVLFLLRLILRQSRHP